MEASEHNSALDTEKIERFFKEVIIPRLYPKAKYHGAYVMGNADVEKFNNARIHVPISFGDFRSSNYYYNGEYKFVHYTSIPSLLNIFREKKIRMYSLNGMDDKDEFDFGSSVMANAPRRQADMIKKKLFCLSMCQYGLEDGEGSLNMWRQFGLDGRGVGIVLKFSRENRNQWYNFVLSKMHYGPESLQTLNAAYVDYANFSKSQNFVVDNFDEFFYKLFCFHKQKIYCDEKEVRLIYGGPQTLFGHDSDVGQADMTSSLKVTSFRDLQIEYDGWKSFTGEMARYQNMAKRIFPYVTIDSLILGYRVSETTRDDLIQTLVTYKDKYTNFPSVGWSKLRKYFV